MPMKLSKRTELSSYHSIIDSAERAFAASGYDGASMRTIAEGAGVAQALLHYHFATKEKLYEEMFKRRSGAINAFREERLKELFDGTPHPTLEALVDVLLHPSPDWLGSKSQSGAYFAAVVGAVSIGSDERSKGLMKKYYDPIAAKFIDAFRRVLPALKHQEAVWAYLFALGARLQASASNERSARLGGHDGVKKSSVIQDSYVRFVASGIRGMVETERPKVKKSSRSTAKRSTVRKSR